MERRRQRVSADTTPPGSPALLPRRPGTPGPHLIIVVLPRVGHGGGGGAAKKGGGTRGGAPAGRAEGLEAAKRGCALLLVKITACLSAAELP